MVSTLTVGFLLGAVVHPVWQAAVESAQALAGIVSYPAANSFYIYHVKLWTLVNQVLALLLKLGFSEIMLSAVLSGVLGALSYAAIGACVFGISRNAYWAIAAPLLIDSPPFRHVLEVNYPAIFIGMEHTYGVLGLAWIVLTISLLATEYHAFAGLMLGLAPAMHPSLGAWCWIISGMALAWSGHRGLATMQKIWKPALAGAAVTIASLLTQLALMRPVLPAVPSEIQQRYIAAFVAYFDYHRQPVEWRTYGVKLTVVAVLIGLYLILIGDEDKDAAPLFLLKATVGAGIIALAGAGISLLPPSAVPSTVLTFMPTRLFLVANLLFTGVAIGLLGQYTNRWMSAAALMLFALLIRPGNTLSFFVVTGAAALFAVWRSFFASSGGIGGVSAPRWLRVAVALLVLAIAARTVGGYLRNMNGNWNAFTGAASRPTARIASQGKGLLVVGQQCCFLTQLLTRRPLLLEANALDQIPYAPESAPITNDALISVYGVDLLNPPESIRPGAPEGLTPVTMPLWEKRSAEEWTQLGRTFGFTQILTNTEWRLNLPEAARDSDQVLYTVPGSITPP